MSVLSEEHAELVAELFKSAAELPAQDRQAFLDEHCRSNPELRAEVESLLQTHESAANFMERPAIDLAAENFAYAGAFAPGQIISHYEIISLIDKGGMGEVYLAADRRLQRRVALKLVRRGMDTDQIVRRFLHEQQLLASLNHPNIAQLYEAGVTPDGIPFFAMENVEGIRIDDYCRKKNLTIQQRLELFAKVCAAVHYAHQHLVVHRDIKPSNILVTTYGEPKLLDFGIAKLLDAVTNVAPERTLTLHNVLTPEYASPEHVRGDPITTASDVYSLGVLLYELLTETKPYKIDNRTPIEIARVITEKEPTKPSTAIRASRFENQHSANSRVTIHDSRRLKGDLDNIVLKAMRKEPLRRYSSVAQFAADIRRHLDGLPVRARKDTFAYRSSKFVSRHRVGVAAAALIFLSLAGGIVFSAHEARRAQQRFNDVRQLAHSLMFEIHDSVQDLQGSTPTRKLIVARALEYLDRLNADGASDPSLQGELATAYEKIGDIQGNPYAANLGDADGALASYRKAMSIRERLNKRASSVQSQIALALSYRGLGDVLELKGDLDERLKNYRRSLEILQRVAATNRDVFQAQDELARGWETLGDGLSRTNDKAETARAYNQTLQIRAQLLGNDPTNPKKKRSMAMALMKTASVPGVQKEEAVANMRRAISTFEEIAAADPQNARARREVGFAYYELGMILAATNDHAEALPVRQRALQIREKFAAQDPKNQQARFDLAVGYGDLAESLANLHAADEAITHAEKAVAIMTELNASDSKNAIYARNLALAYERLAQAFETGAHNENASTTKRTQNFSSAREYYAKARDLFAGLRDRGALLPMDRDQIDKFNSRIAGADQQLAQLRR